jgi:hypothetical protein
MRHTFSRHRPESGRSSIPAALVIESRGRGVLYRPVKPVTGPDGDAVGRARCE